MTRWASRLSCCSRSVWRLSYSFLPRATPISTFARPSTKYSCSGTIVNPDSRILCEIFVSSSRCSLVGPAPLVVLGDVDALHLQLVVIERAEAVHHRGMALAQGLNFRAHQRDAGFISVKD